MTLAQKAKLYERLMIWFLLLFVVAFFLCLTHMDAGIYGRRWETKTWHWIGCVVLICLMIVFGVGRDRIYSKHEREEKARNKMIEMEEETEKAWKRKLRNQSKGFGYMKQYYKA